MSTGDPAASRSTTKKLIFALLLALVVVATSEAICFVIVSLRFKRIASPPALFASYHAELGKRKGPAGSMECEWADYVSPSPYLVVHYHHGQACTHPYINQIGLAGREIPISKDSDYYNILVLGGSVAELFAVSTPMRNSPLEDLLNREYQSPNGKPFRIVNGAIAGGVEPMQAVSFLLFQDLADAVIELDGYNEHYVYGSPTRLGTPPEIWNQMMGATNGAYRGLLLRQAAHAFYVYLRENPVFSRSYGAFLLGYDLLALTEYPFDEVPERVIPEFPWNVDKAVAKRDFISQYRKYLFSVDAVARARGIPDAFFIQPAPALDKKLTDRERQIVGDLSYGKDYLELATRLMKFRGAGLPIFSLLDTFKNYPGEIYTDHIHFTGPGPGNEMLAEAMARQLEREWKLKKRSH